MTPDKRHRTDAESPELPEAAQEASVVKDAENTQGRSASPLSGGGLEQGNRGTLPERAKRLSNVPRKYRQLYLRAWQGQSRKSAIRAFCLECVCWSQTEVRLCTAPACPLFEFRLKG